MSEEVQAKEKSIEVSNVDNIRKKNSPKITKEVLRAIKVKFEEGSYKSLKELAHEFKVSYVSLRKRVSKEKWNQSQITLQNKVSQRIESKILKEVDQATSYLASSFLRAKKYEQLIDKSVAQNDEVISPEHLDAYSRTELRIHELAKSSLRIVPVSQVDHTTGGLSFVQAIASLRESKSLPSLSEVDLKQAIDAEIV